MSLSEYRRKRDFDRTAEPQDRRNRKGGGKLFVIQLHHARARHFDFRLQVGKALASWAVPKGPSLRAGEKRLAVQVEDHPLDYADFEGIIPEGNYGAGDVQVVERGRWHPVGDAAKGIAAGKLDFELEGEHLRGQWKLIRTGRDGKRAQWLLMKRSDAFAADTDLDTLVHAGGAKSPRARAKKPAVRSTAVTKAKSVQSAGATNAKKKIARPANPAKAATITKTAPASRITKSKTPSTRSAKTGSVWRKRAQRLAGAIDGNPNAPPQLATLSKSAPDGDDWLHEVKWDGYRLLVRRDGDTLRLQSRNAIDWSGRYAAIEQALRALPVHSLQIDAELVVLDKNGRSDFSELQRALEGSGKGPLSCAVFDLLALEGVDLTGVAQIERKRLLEALLAKRPSPLLAYSQHIVGHGPTVFAASQRQGLEGIMSKRVDAPYVGGRSRQWLKVKRNDGLDATVVGYTAPQRSRTGLGSLMLALPEKAGWRYIGRVGTGMDEAMLKALRTKLHAVRRDEPVLDLPAHVPLSPRAITWVEPRLVVEVEHRGWGKQGLLRQASFLRLRPDKSVRDPASALADVRITHPERKVYRSPATTKRDVADYYQSVAPWMLPGISGRPLSILRAPDGVPGETFFQKHAGQGLGDAVKSLKVREKSGKRAPYIMVEDVSGLLQLVQMNALEFHPWGAHADDVEQPDRMVFDLDPGPGVTWKAILAGARAVRAQLKQLGLASFPLVSGGKGVHVVVPLAPGHDWPQVKAFSRAIAQFMEQRSPTRYVSTASKARRDGRIFIDWLRNARGATSIAAWSLRARPGAKVAMPVRWEELGKLSGPDHFNIAAALRRAATLKAHPWGDFAKKPGSDSYSGGFLPK